MSNCRRQLGRARAPNERRPARPPSEIPVGGRLNGIEIYLSRELRIPIGGCELDLGGVAWIQFTRNQLSLSCVSCRSVPFARCRRQFGMSFQFALARAQRGRDEQRKENEVSEIGAAAGSRPLAAAGRVARAMRRLESRGPMT